MGTARLYNDSVRDGRAARRNLAVHHARADGTDYPNRVEYEEVVEPERLLYSHGADDDSDFSPFHVTVTFEDEGDGLKCGCNCAVTPADRERAIERGEGGNQTLERYG